LDVLVIVASTPREEQTERSELLLVEASAHERGAAGEGDELLPDVCYWRWILSHQLEYRGFCDGLGSVTAAPRRS